jgi:hypothetical protein
MRGPAASIQLKNMAPKRIIATASCYPPNQKAAKRESGGVSPAAALSDRIGEFTAAA